MAKPETPPTLKLGIDLFSIRSQNWSPIQYLDYCAAQKAKVVHFSEVRFIGGLAESNLRQVKQHADELGIEIALAAGAGWCGAGGPWIKPEESMQFLSTSETRITGPAKFDAQLARPQARTPFFGEDTLTPELRKQWSDFYVDEFVLAFPAPAGGARIAEGRAFRPLRMGFRNNVGLY